MIAVESLAVGGLAVFLALLVTLVAAAFVGGC